MSAALWTFRDGAATSLNLPCFPRRHSPTLDEFIHQLCAEANGTADVNVFQLPPPDFLPDCCRFLPGSRGELIYRE
jgi:hypothetical protein